VFLGLFCIVGQKNTKKKKLPRQFYVNGAIKRDQECFFVNPEKSNEQLLDSINRGKYIFLQGVRGSGKTTRCLYAINYQLANYCCLYVSLQGLEVKDTKIFWSDLSSRLFKYNEDKIHIDQVTPITRAEDFMVLLRTPEVFEEKKKVVLFVDEFDLLLYGNEEIRNSFLNAFREMKQNNAYCIHSLIAIGPLKIFDVTKTAPKISPFNVNETLSTPTLTEEETKNLFKEFCNEYNFQIENTVIEDIYKRTGGHAGHTCLCGKEIHETLLRNTNTLKYDDWLPFAIQTIPKVVSARWKIGSSFQRQIQEDTESQELFLNYFLSNECHITLKDNDIQKGINLSSVGVLTGDSYSNEFWIPSPLIRAIIWSVLSINEQLPVSPPVKDGYLSVVDVIKNGLPFFRKQTMIRSLVQSFKKNRDEETDVKYDQKVPNEHTYQVELTLVLRKWFSSSNAWHIDTEVNSESKKCDIVITNTPNGPKYVIELIAHAPLTAKKNSSDFYSTLKGHFERADKYKKILNAHEAWVINFTTRHPSKGYLWPNKSLQINVIHVYHKLDWTEAWVVTSEIDKEGTLIKLL